MQAHTIIDNFRKKIQVQIQKFYTDHQAKDFIFYKELSLIYQNILDTSAEFALLPMSYQIDRDQLLFINDFQDFMFLLFNDLSQKCFNIRSFQDFSSRFQKLIMSLELSTFQQFALRLSPLQQTIKQSFCLSKEFAEFFNTFFDDILEFKRCNGQRDNLYRTEVAVQRIQQNMQQQTSEINSIEFLRSDNFVIHKLNSQNQTLQNKMIELDAQNLQLKTLNNYLQRQIETEIADLSDRVNLQSAAVDDNSVTSLKKSVFVMQQVISKQKEELQAFDEFRYIFDEEVKFENVELHSQSLQTRESSFQAVADFGAQTAGQTQVSLHQNWIESVVQNLVYYKNNFNVVQMDFLELLHKIEVKLNLQLENVRLFIENQQSGQVITCSEQVQTQQVRLTSQAATQTATVILDFQQQTESNVVIAITQTDDYYTPIIIGLQTALQLQQDQQTRIEAEYVHNVQLLKQQIDVLVKQSEDYKRESFQYQQMLSEITEDNQLLLSASKNLRIIVSGSQDQSKKAQQLLSSTQQQSQVQTSDMKVLKEKIRKLSSLNAEQSNASELLQLENRVLSEKIKQQEIASSGYQEQVAEFKQRYDKLLADFQQQSKYLASIDQTSQILNAENQKLISKVGKQKQLIQSQKSANKLKSQMQVSALELSSNRDAMQLLSRDDIASIFSD